MLLLPRWMRILDCLLRVVISLYQQSSFVWIWVCRGIAGCDVRIGCPLAEVTHDGGDGMVYGGWGGVVCSAAIRMETQTLGLGVDVEIRMVGLRRGVERQPARTTVFGCHRWSRGIGIVINTYTGRVEQGTRQTKSVETRSARAGAGACWRLSRRCLFGDNKTMPWSD